jgi:hypothetical protein
MRRKNDILWKGIPTEVFEDLLRFVFPDVDVDTITDKKYTMGIIEQVAEMREAEGMKKGLKRGEKKASRLFVENLLNNSNFSLQKIASLANVSIDFVKKVKKEISSK